MPRAERAQFIIGLALYLLWWWLVLSSDFNMRTWSAWSDEIPQTEWFQHCIQWGCP